MPKPDAALDLLHGLVLEDGARWGERAAPFQADDAAAVLDLAGPRRHFLTRGRGGSKTTDLAGVTIAALLAQLPPGSRSHGFAADRGQARFLLDAAAGFKQRTEGLGALTVGAGHLANERTKAVLSIEASDDASAFGIRPPLVIVDEFAQWPRSPRHQRLYGAIRSSMQKVPGSRLVILTSAGDPTHSSFKVLEAARVSPRWRVSETPGPVPWQDVDELEELRAELLEWEYRRFVLNEWAESDERLSSVGDLAACVVLDGPREPAGGRAYVIALDVGLKNDRTVAAVCSVDEWSTTVALDRMAVWQGTRAAPVQLDEVEAWLLQAWGAYGRPPIVADPYQAAQLAQRLRARGVWCVEFAFTQQSVSRLAVRLHQLIRDHALALPDDELLLEELANVRLLEPHPGVYRLDHAAGQHDDRAITLALAAWGLLDSGLWGGVDELVDVEDVLGEDIEVRISPY